MGPTRKRTTFLVSLLTGTTIFGSLAVSLLDDGARAQSLGVSPRDVRAAAFQAGLDSLGNVVVNDPGGLADFVRTGNGPGGIDPVARQALIQLGKSLFWDRQVGSDGQACGSPLCQRE